MIAFYVCNFAQALATVGRRALSTTSAVRASGGGFSVQLTDEQQEIQDLARKFTRDEVSPRAHHHDVTGEFPWDIVKKAHSVGLMNTHIPQEFGETYF